MDPLQDVLNLEEQYHAEGYALGIADGQAAGRSEGRQFGMEKGFEKFVELGRLNGWTATLADNGEADEKARDRLQRQLARLQELTDIENIQTENSEDGVADVDERIRDAKAKAILLAKMLGKDTSKTKAISTTGDELEDFGGLGRRGASTS